MSPKHLLALDPGTSSSRSIVFSGEGAIVGMAQREFRQIFPKPGWVEHDPREIWETQLATAREAIANSGIAAGDIAAIGITNQRETTLLWNRSTGEPLANAVVWQDRCTAPACEALKERGLEALFRQKTGLVLDAYFSGTKLAWLLDHVPGARAAAERGELAFGTVDSWLMWMLTGGGDAATRRHAVHATDASNASRTLLFDIHAGASANDLLMQFQADLLGIPVLRPRVTETTALGAAYLAGLSCGVYAGTDELAAQWQIERTFHPTLSRTRAAELMQRWEHAVGQAAA